MINAENLDFTDAQELRLKRFLASHQRPRETLSYNALAGFLFAISCAPDLIPMSEWLPLVFGGDEEGFENDEEAREILFCMMSFYNSVNDAALDDCRGLPPGCILSSNPMDNLLVNAPLSEWSKGFLRGYAFSREAWDVRLDDGKRTELDKALVVLTFFSRRELAENMASLVENTTLAELSTAMLGFFPGAIGTFANLGQSAFRELLGKELARARSRQIGRNDSCPCGSGKKYKRCCG